MARFFGLVPKSALQDDSALLAFMEGEQTEIVEQEEASEEQVEAIVIVAGGVVVKKDESSHTKRPVRKCVYEEAPGEMWGVGIAGSITYASLKAITSGVNRAYATEPVVQGVLGGV